MSLGVTVGGPTDDLHRIWPRGMAIVALPCHEDGAREDAWWRVWSHALVSRITPGDTRLSRVVHTRLGIKKRLPRTVSSQGPRDLRGRFFKPLFQVCWLGWFMGVCLPVSDLLAAPPYRQPAYISNAYFSDKMTEEEQEVLRPLAVVKALRSRSSGVVGYFILDLILVRQGAHRFKVNILNPRGEKVSDLLYPAVHVPEEGDWPLYTAAGAVTGGFSPGLWFFKVFDQVEEGAWFSLGTFSIMVLDPVGSPASGGPSASVGSPASARSPASGVAAPSVGGDGVRRPLPLP